RLSVAPDQLCPAVDDDLRRVDALEIEVGAVDPLTIRQRRRRETILPAEPIPVVDMLPERDDFDAGDRLHRDELLEHAVGRRAVRTALRGEQLDDDRCRLRRAKAGTVESKDDGHDHQRLQGSAHRSILIAAPVTHPWLPKSVLLLRRYD